ncbi:serine protease [Coprinellus micaceus]|uniref:Serine protease n=1 Tax=Coprinellus micaceus TaxID=71717 RepID=A0A4Y7S8N0_COPMI|nr:serine protease [Coprinellus micaceus]
MRFLTVLCSICTILPVFAGPTSLPISVSIDIFPGEKAAGHIVRLKDGASKENVVREVVKLLFGKLGKLGITHEYECALNGFAGIFDPVTLAALQMMPGVASISENGIVRTTETVTQSNAPWGLSRLSSASFLPHEADPFGLDYSYAYDSKAGKDVDIYIIDTGIRFSHKDFEGRARWAYTAPTAVGLPTDGNGHGTHCAGTAAGTQYGVAKKAKLHGVKVLSDLGSGTTSDVISGMDFVLCERNKFGRPTVASMSLGGGISPPLDAAAQKLVEGGVHLVVAAGNDNADADATSPAHVREAITVGASNITDGRAYFSNYGPAVDVFAPGVNVTSAWNDSDNGTNTISGTSMATPHIAGLVAYLLSLGDSTMTPAAMSQWIKDLALKGILNDIPSGTTNILAQNDLA